MFVMIRDTANNQGPVVYNPDPNAQRKTSWQEWNIKLTDLNTPNVNLKQVKYLFIGLGLRCNKQGTAGIPGGGSGQVWFDNIRLEKHCGLTADFTGDCEVNMDDLRVLSEVWLRCGICGNKADIYPKDSPDGIVDFRDFALLAQQWLEEEP
jgi:hypothetical protein